MNTTNGSYQQSNLDVDNVLKYTTYQTVLIAVVMASVSLITIGGNLLVIYVYFKTKSLQSARNYFILSLACADIIVGLIPANLYAVYMLLGHWPFGSVACYFWLITDHWSFTISNLTLVAIAGNRYLAINFPIMHRVHFSECNVKRVIRIIWFVSFLVWGPAILLYPLLNEKITVVASNHCYIQFYFESSYITVTVAVCSYFGPVMLITIAYICISCKLEHRCNSIYRKDIHHPRTISENQLFPTKIRSKTVEKEIVYLSGNTPKDCTINIEQISQKSENIACTLPNYNGVIVDLTDIKVSVTENANVEIDSGYYGKREDTLGSSIQKMNRNTFIIRKVCKKSSLARIFTFGGFHMPNITRHNSIRAHRRGVCFLFLVSLVFVICWMPYHIMIVMLSITKTTMSEHLWRFCYIIGWLNSTINPCCYALCNSKFRRGLTKVFCHKKQKATT